MKETEKEKRRAYAAKWKRTEFGLIINIYATQRGNSRKRGHKPPEYTSAEFREWIDAQPHFKTLFDDWVASGYDKKTKPSVDRLDDSKGYSFKNIRLITWEENHLKQATKVTRGYIMFFKRSETWEARVQINRKVHCIKSSKDKVACEQALEEFRKKFRENLEASVVS